jgi:hypothetical protein
MNDQTLMRALRAADALEVEKAPKQHPLRTPHCPPLTRFPSAIREGWAPEEREHVTGCPYCQRVTALEWRAECPILFDWTLYVELRSPDQEAMRYHLEHDRCPRCRELVALVRDTEPVGASADSDHHPTARRASKNNVLVRATPAQQEASMECILFDGDDDAYQAWLEDHPGGYVINTRRRPGFDPSLMVLHRASCRLIRDYNEMAQEGGFTERKYVKICSVSISALREWVRQHGRPDGSFSKECSHCNPCDGQV